MKVELRPLELSALDALRCEVLIVPYFAHEKPLRGLGELVDWRQYSKISQMQASSAISGAAGETAWVALDRPLRVPKAIFFGLGQQTIAWGQDQLAEACTKLVAALQRADLRALALQLPGRSTNAVGAESALRAWLAALGPTSPVLELIIFDDVEQHSALRAALSSR